MGPVQGWVRSSELGGWPSSGPTCAQVKVYIQQLVEGLQYLHSHGVLHLDIKVPLPQSPGCPASPTVCLPLRQGALSFQQPHLMELGSNMTLGIPAAHAGLMDPPVSPKTQRPQGQGSSPDTALSDILTLPDSPPTS